jgi:hypothetical protein
MTPNPMLANFTAERLIQKYFMNSACHSMTPITGFQH